MTSERLNNVFHYSLFTIHFSLFTFHYSLFTIRLNPSKHLRNADSLGGLAALYGTSEGIGGVIMGVGAHTKVTREVTGKLREALFPIQRHLDELLHRRGSGKDARCLVLILMKRIKARQSVACVP